MLLSMRTAEDSRSRPRRVRRCPAAALALIILAALPAYAFAQRDPVSRSSNNSNSLGIDYSYVTFQGDIDPWQQAALSLGRRTSRGMVFGRLNYANRFATSGLQVEGDAYPVLSKRTYAYLNAGYSRSSIFPEWRVGGELFTSLPRAWEASLGFRQLRFGGPPVTLLTGSAGKYHGNYWYSVRPYLRKASNGYSKSANLTTRRYFADADNYFGARVGYGSTPGDPRDPSELARSNTISMGVHGSRTVRPRTIGTWLFSYDREEPIPDRFRNRWEFMAGAKFLY